MTDIIIQAERKLSGLCPRCGYILPNNYFIDVFVDNIRGAKTECFVNDRGIIKSCNNLRIKPN